MTILYCHTVRWCTASTNALVGLYILRLRAHSEVPHV